MATKTAEEKRIEALVSAITNKDLREAVKYFDVPVDELSAIDQLIIAAHKNDPSKSLEEYDNMPITELNKVLACE